MLSNNATTKKKTGSQQILVSSNIPDSPNYKLIMPRLARAIRDFQVILEEWLEARQGRQLFDKEDPWEDGMDLAAYIAYENATQKRYLFRKGKGRKGPSESRFKTDLKSDREGGSDTSSSSVQPWLNDDEFLQKCRVSRKGFNFLLNMIKDHPVFNTTSSIRKQAPVSFHLMTWLKYVGTEGSGASNSNQRNTFGIEYGPATVYCNRVTKALCSFLEEFIRWPDEEERRTIALEMLKQYGFPHCVSIADGTLFPLAFEPETEDAPDYSGRKYGYSLSTMIFCDPTVFSWISWFGP
jgi:hypothetical protein